MAEKLWETYQTLKARGMSPRQEAGLLRDIRGAGLAADPARIAPEMAPSVYSFFDLMMLQSMPPAQGNYTSHIRTIDELLAKDRQREKDGFPRKIRVGRMIKPGRGGKDKVVVIPTTAEEKFIHDPSFKETDDDSASGGSGKGEAGEVIGEEPVRQSGQGSGAGPGQGEGGQHELESSAYDLGRILTEQFELPNLKDKGKKRSLTRYTYDLTDRNRGFGQLLDKKATLRRVIETNIHLGNLGNVDDIDPTGFLISPKDHGLPHFEPGEGF